MICVGGGAVEILKSMQPSYMTAIQKQKNKKYTSTRRFVMFMCIPALFTIVPSDRVASKLSPSQRGGV